MLKEVAPSGEMNDELNFKEDKSIVDSNPQQDRIPSTEQEIQAEKKFNELVKDTIHEFIFLKPKSSEKKLSNLKKLTSLGLVMVGVLNTSLGRQASADFINGFMEWNPMNIKYRIQDSSARMMGRDKPESLREFITAKEIKTQAEGIYGETEEYKSSIFIKDVELDLLVDTSVLKDLESHRKLLPTEKIELKNIELESLYKFEYYYLKPPEDAAGFRGQILKSTNKLLSEKRSKEREKFEQKEKENFGQERHRHQHPLLIEVQKKLDALGSKATHNEYESLRKDFRTAYAEIAKRGEQEWITDFPPELAVYRENEGPGNIEEFLLVLDSIVAKKIKYDVAVESWLAPTSGETKLRGGTGNLLTVGFSSDGTPIDKLLREGGQGVCRHYAEAYGGVAKELSEMFPGKFQNLHVASTLSAFRSHEYNTIYVVESPTLIHAVNFEPQGGTDVGEEHADTPAFELLEQMYLREMISKNDFYQSAANYFEAGGVESKVDLFAFLDRASSDRSDVGRRVVEDTLNMTEEYLDKQHKLEKEKAEDSKHWLYEKLNFIKETQKYRERI